MRPVSAALLGLALTAGLAAAPAVAGQPPDGAVAGVVYFEDGTPAANARLVLVPGGLNATASSDGGFRIEAPEGNYTLHASASNATAEASIRVEAGRTTAAVLRIDRGGRAPAGLDPFPFVFLALSMIGVTVGGFYVNRRMAETGIDINKSIVGGARPRKPFRRRSRKRAPPPSP